MIVDWLLLLGVAEHAEIDLGVFEIAGDVDVINGDEPGLLDRQFATNGLANLAFQQFTHPQQPVRRHTTIPSTLGHSFGATFSMA